jgi:shikimate kinase
MSRRGAVAHPSRVLLVGLMAVGKSTVGTILAHRLDARYLDNDALVAATAGASLQALLARDGKAGLRQAESAALGVALDTPPPVVAGVAAGVAESPSDRARLATADATVVWLRASPETLAARVAGGGERPWLRPDPLAAFIRMQAERDPFYADVADLVCDVDDASADEIAGRAERFVRDRLARGTG